jgi:hypothetical protein
MSIDGVTITLYQESEGLMADDQFEVLLFRDSGSDIYPDDIEIPDDIQDKINEIRNICF